jgi:hypothetical protein
VEVAHVLHADDFIKERRLANGESDGVVKKRDGLDASKTTLEVLEDDGW